VPPYRIIAIDGGGIRGIIPAMVLARLAKEVPGFLGRTNLFAGTSTGGLIALALANGSRPEELADLYRSRGAQIFRDSIVDDVLDLGRMLGAEYGGGELSRAVRTVLGDVTLGELKKKVLVPAFDLDDEDPGGARRWKPKFFHNFRGSDSDSAVSARRVALYTTAAPTYFPSVDGYIDGGVVANNPSVAAIAQTQDGRTTERRPRLDRIVLLSLGTGRSLLHIRGKRHDWGLSQWAKPLVKILFDGDLDIADYQCRQILGERYLRVNIPFPPDRSIALDDTGELPFLEEHAEKADLSPALNWIRTHWAPPPGRRRGTRRHRGISA
jgi:hypothetical protein